MAQVGPSFSQINMIEMSNRAREQVGERVRKVRKPRRQRFPLALERQYAARIKEVVEFMRTAVNEILVPILPDIIREAKAIRKDDYTDTLARAIQLIGAQTADLTGGAAGLASFIEEHGVAVSKFNKAEVITIMRGAIGVDIFLSDPALMPKLRGFAKVNAAKIESIAAFRLPEIERLVLQEIENGTRVEVIRGDIQKQFNVDRSKADLLARDQTSKLNGDLTKLRQVEIGVQSYKWRTVGDDAVRDNHASKEGVTFKWSDPPADTGHPGQDFQCRCYAEPVLESLTGIPEPKGATLSVPTPLLLVSPKRLAPTRPIRPRPERRAVPAQKMRPAAPQTPRREPAPEISTKGKKHLELLEQEQAQIETATRSAGTAQKGMRGAEARLQAIVKANEEVSTLIAEIQKKRQARLAALSPGDRKAIETEITRQVAGFLPATRRRPRR